MLWLFLCMDSYEPVKAAVGCPVFMQISPAITGCAADPWPVYKSSRSSVMLTSEVPSREKENVACKQITSSLFIWRKRKGNGSVREILGSILGVSCKTWQMLSEIRSKSSLPPLQLRASWWFYFSINTIWGRRGTGYWIELESWLAKRVVLPFPWEQSQLRDWWDIMTGAQCSGWKVFHGTLLARDGSAGSEVSWGHLNFIKLGTGGELTLHQPEHTNIPLISLSRLSVQKQAVGRHKHLQSTFFVLGPHLVSNMHIQMLFFHISLLLNCWCFQAEIYTHISELWQPLCAVHKVALHLMSKKKKKILYKVPKLSVRAVQAF